MTENPRPPENGSRSNWLVRWFRGWRLVSWRSAVLTLYILYVLFGFFGVPPIVRNLTVKTLRERAGLQATVRKVRFNPFTLSLTFEGLSIADRPGSVLFSAEEIYANAETSSLFRWAATLKELRVEKPMVALRRYADGRVNVAEVYQEIQRRKPKKAAADSDKTLPRALIQRIRVAGSTLTIEDLTRPKPLKMGFGPSDYELAEISTIPNRKGTDEIKATLPGGATVRATGHVIVQPVGLEGDVTIESLYLKELWPLLEPYFKFQVDGGVVTGRFHYAVSMPAAGVQATVRDFDITMKDLKVVHENEPVLEVPAASIVGASLLWPQGNLGVKQIRIERSRMLIRRDPDGGLNWTKMVPKPTQEVVVETYRKIEKAAKWTIDLGRFENVDSLARFEDHKLSKPVALEASDIQLLISGFTTRKGKEWTIVSSASLPNGATTKTNGKASLGPPRFESEVLLAGLDFTVAQPYVALMAPLEIVSGKASSKGKIAGGIDPKKGPWVKFTGDAGIEEMAVRETVMGSTPVKWTAVRATGVEAGYGPLIASVNTLDIRGAVIDVVISEQGALSVIEVKKAMTKASPAPSSASPSSSPPPPPQEASSTTDSAPIPIRVGVIKLKDCSAALTDRRMQPAFTVALDKIQGTVKEIARPGKTPTQLEIGGTVRGGGALTLKGSLDPFQPKRATQITLDLKNVEIPPMSPMSILYVGYPVTKGQTVVGLQYEIQSNQLNGKNHLMTQDLTLGDKVEGKGKVNLPVKLGVSLLTDGEGRITLDFPVQADLADRNVAITKAIGSAVSEVTSELVKSPFRVLSKIGGGKGGKDGDDQGFVDFAPGSAELDAASADRLKAIAAGLGKRPQLRLVVAGVWDETADATALREATLEKQLAQRGAKNATVPSRSELEGLYKDAAGSEKLAALRQSHMKASGEGAKAALDELAYDEALREAVLESQSVGAAEFDALGQARAASVRSALVEQAGLDASRVELAAPRAVSGSEAGRVRLPLEVAGAGGTAQAAKAE